jgi:acid phosphatase (class A)
MKPLPIFFVAGALLCGMAGLAAQTPSTRVPLDGFLSPALVPDVLHIVPSAPSTGDSRYTSDMDIFKSTRALQGTARWALALADDDVSAAGLFKAFQCAVGAQITRENAPLVTTLVARANVDASRASNAMKQFYQHKRPYQVADAPVCVSAQRRDDLARSPDYPSGHTILSWETALVLSRLAPDRASEIFTRARAFGESRVVCGVHNLSAVEAGWMTAGIVFAAQDASADFQAAITAAKPELSALRAHGAADAGMCAAEAAVLAKDPY